jgi:hypothetical protein
MREGVGNYIHFVWTVLWTVPSLFLILIASSLVRPHPADPPASTGGQGESLQPAFTSPAVSREVPSFHRLEFLDSPAPVCLGYINISFRIHRQSVGMGKCTDLVTRTPEA